MNKKKESDDVDMEIGIWRSVYQEIPQLNKPGADGITPTNSIGIVLTEDVMVGYIDETNGQDTLYIILVWSKVDDMYKENGWCLPGKRDRAYDKHKGDISVEDANYYSESIPPKIRRKICRINRPTT